MKSEVFTTMLGGKQLSIETGKLAQLASGSVTVRCGDTVVLATAVVSAKAKEDAEYFPLLVDYEERLYAAGKISGSRFIKREGRPSERAILTCRLVDRPIRPLFPKKYRNDVQVIITVLSYDGENNPDILAIIAASAALSQTPAPFEGPVSAVRVGLIDGKFVANPSEAEMELSTLDLVVAGVADKVMMVEAGAKEVTEADFIKAIEFGQKELQPGLEIQKKLIADTKHTTEDPGEAAIVADVKKYLGDKLANVMIEMDKAKRDDDIATFEADILKNFEGDYKQSELKTTLSDLLEKEVRHAIVDKGIRPDGRKLDEIRPIDIEIGLLPRTHGTGLFTRGQTQVMSIVTLGAPGEEQTIETMEEEGTKRYMHHYNFPPFSTGEVKPIRGTSRREIGHGALAERALIAVIPSKEDFPYTIRVVSEVLASNGSSSMASTCGSTLALMDAGVPIKSPVAGIAMGLMTLGDKHKVLTDIQGLEDFAGDMDYKLTGTKNGITACQMDTKLKGLSVEWLEEATLQAREGINFILAKIEKVIAEPRAELSPYAPRITSLRIEPEKIGELIGPGGKNIRKIIEDCGGGEIISIDIEDDGLVMISSTDAAAAKKAEEIIAGSMREPKVGEVFEGPVVQILKDRMRGNEIGAIVQILPNKDGMVHISQIANERIEKVSDKVKVGDIVKVKVVEVDREKGRVSLSMKDVE